MEGSSKKKILDIKSVLDKFGRIFSVEGDTILLQKYSSKMSSIIKKLKKVRELLLFILIILMADVSWL